MKNTFLLLALLSTAACTQTEFRKSSSCAAKKVSGGVLLTCDDGSSNLIHDGKIGNPGAPGSDGNKGDKGDDGATGPQGPKGDDAQLQVIDPCGDAPGIIDEVVIKMPDGSFLALLTANLSGDYSRLALLPDGSYVTSDGSNCLFSIAGGNYYDGLPPTPAPRVNLASGATTTASSEWDSMFAAGKATDGDTSTRWNSGHGTSSNEWLEIDFGTPKTVTNVVTKESFFRITNYKIQAYDGSNWNDVATGTTIGASKSDTFSAVVTSKIRLLVVSTQYDYGDVCPSIFEMEVYE